MKRLKAINLLALTVAAIALSSCSANEPAGDDMQRGKKYPLTLTAYVADVQARSTGKDAWSDGDEIGVSLSSTLANGDAYSVEGKYKYDSNNGGMSAVNGSEIYWQSTNAANVTAWFPCDDVPETNISDQSAGYTDIDFLKAETSDVSFNTSATLAFNHRMSKVTCTLVKGEQLPDDLFAQAKLTISGYTSASFSKGDVTPIGSLGDITPYANGDDTYTALLVPYTLSTSSPLFTISIGNTTFYYIPSEETTLEAGYAYNYTITVKTDGIEVDCSEIGEWGEGDDTTTVGSTVFEVVYLSDITDDTYTVGTGKRILIIGDENTYDRQIVISDNAIAKLKNVKLSTYSDKCLIYASGNATLRLSGDNTVDQTSSSYANNAAVSVAEGKTLTIDGTGSLTVKSQSYGTAAIGAGDESSCGNITINGGTVTAYGGDDGAGMGSGYYSSDCGNITINGGTVTAIGGDFGAGIGSGYRGSCGDITINGGTVTATGGYDGAGIGAGSHGSSCSDITINGGTVTTTGGDGGAGIGSGMGDIFVDVDNGLYVFNPSSVDNITIRGGNVYAYGGYNSAGIGTGYNGVCGDILITGTKTVVTAEGGYYCTAIGRGTVDYSLQHNIYQIEDEILRFKIIEFIENGCRTIKYTGGATVNGVVYN